MRFSFRGLFDDAARTALDTQAARAKNNVS
jgi:hypothetical protein